MQCKQFNMVLMKYFWLILKSQTIFHGFHCINALGKQTEGARYLSKYEKIYEIMYIKFLRLKTKLIFLDSEKI